MNEVEELLKIDLEDLPPLKPVELDDLYQKVQKNLYLEVGTGAVLFLLSPSYSALNQAPSDTINELVTKKEPLLDYLKEAIIQNLAAYSALLDVNSYFIEQNNFLVLARLREKDSGGRRYEIKFYTHSPVELMTHYEDKIYIGRDFLDLFNFKRKYFGIREFLASLKDQSEKLVDKAEEKLKKPLDYKSFFQEIKESVSELNTEAQAILESLPPYLDFGKLSEKDLIDINAQYRAINHFLIELHDEVGEFENLLRFKMEIDFVRYVTKYKKDVTNLISYFNIKINGGLSQRIYHFKAKHSS
ncbi:MAG: hypothetical protein NTV82_14595 [Candidatus Aminicenantes bacterium]|nr:hypothetical protein [Candidatus Aminicenantes bacterium]